MGSHKAAEKQPAAPRAACPNNCPVGLSSARARGTGPCFGTQPRHHDPRGPQPGCPQLCSHGPKPIWGEILSKKPHSSLIALGRLSSASGAGTGALGASPNPPHRTQPPCCATTVFARPPRLAALYPHKFIFLLSFQPPQWPGVRQRIRQGKTPSAGAARPGWGTGTAGGQRPRGWPCPVLSSASPSHHLLSLSSEDICCQKQPGRRGTSRAWSPRRCLHFALPITRGAGAASSLHPHVAEEGFEPLSVAVT